MSRPVMTDTPPPPPPEEIPPPPPEPGDNTEATAQPKRCGKAFASLLLGLIGCLLGGVALAGILYEGGTPQNVQINGNLNQMQDVVVEDAKQRGIKMFLASFGQWFGAIGALLGLTGFVQGTTHLYRASVQLVIPQRWLAGFGSFFSFVACLSIIAALKHGYDAHVGLPTENANEAFNRVEQVAGIMKRGQDIAEGKEPAPAGGLDEQARGIAEQILGGSLSPITRLWTEDYLNRPAPDMDLYTTAGTSLAVHNMKNSRVLLMVMSGNSPACRQAVPHLNRIRAEVPYSQLLIVAVSTEKTNLLDAFVNRSQPKFPVGTANFMPEPYRDAEVKPTYFVLNRQGVIERILIGPQSYDQLRAAALGN